MLRISTFLVVGVLSNYHVVWLQNQTVTNTTWSLETTHKPIANSQNHTEGINSTVISIKNNTGGIGNDVANISSENTSFTGPPLPTVPLEVQVTNVSASSTLSPIVCKLKNIINPPYYQNSSCYSSSDALKCFHDPIFCKRHFKSGHRDLQDKRPTYGEYSLLAHQQWFHVIQHGGVAFLYHPCASEEEVVKMRQVASQCLHRHILAPYHKLTEDMPLALVSWGCYFISTSVHSAEMKDWIRDHAYRGPASHVHTNGKYNQNLLKESEVVTDVKDAIICPSKKQKFLFVPTQPPTTPKQKQSVRDHESIIKNRVIKLSKIKPGITVMTNLTITKVKTGSAVWAAASLIFLCGILVGWLVYTRQLSGSGGGSHKYNPVSSCEKDSFECEPGESQFNMLKSNQKFMSAFRWRTSHGGHKDLKDSMSTVHLMVPIDEEGDSEETMFYSR